MEPQTLLGWRMMKKQSQFLQGAYSLREETMRKLQLYCHMTPDQGGKHKLSVSTSTLSSLLPKSNAEAPSGEWEWGER